MNTNQPTLLSSLRTLPRPAWILCFGTFLNKFGAFVVPFLALYLTSRGCTSAQIGIALAAYGAGNLIASLLGGYLADRIGRRQTIVLSMFTGAAMMMLLSQATSLPLIILLAALMGIAGEMYRPASSALLTDLVKPEQRVTAFATLRMSLNAGFAFGPAMAGLLAGYGYFWLFAGDAATSVLFGVVAMFALPQGVHGTQKNADWSEAWKVVRHDHKLHQILAANLCIGMVFFQVISAYGLFVTQLGFSPAVYGVLISLNGVIIVLCELPLTTITRRYPTRHVMAVGYLVDVSLGFALNAFAHSLTALVICTVILTIGEMITMPMAAAYVADLAPPHMRGRYMGVSGLTWSVALIIGPAMGIKLLASNPMLFWGACGALGVLAATIILMPVKGMETKSAVTDQ